MGMARGLAIIGYGGMGQWHHKGISENNPGISISGAYDIREEACAKAAASGLRVYNSFQEAIDDPAVDIILITTPNDIHKDLSIAALKAGKHVICEKPVTMNAAELEEVIPVAKQTGKLFSIHHNRRWDRDFVIVKKILGQNIIGKPYYIESRVQGARRNMHGWRSHAVNGGGMVLDWGIHLLDQLLFLTDSPVVSVDAHLFKVFSTECEDNFKTFLRFENGLSALVEISTNSFIGQPRWHISCEDGTAVIKNFDLEGEIVRIVDDGGMEWADEIVYTSAGPTRTMAPRPKHTMEALPLPELHKGEYGEYTTHYTPYYENITAVLDGRADPIVTPEQALRVMKLVDTIFRCAAQGHGEACRI